MSIKNRSKQIIVGGAAAVGLALGVAALAGAAPSPTPKQEAQDPNLNGSIQFPEDESASEADEAKTLGDLAKVSSADAEKAALAAVPGGTVLGSALENDNGSVIYEVDMTDTNGKSIEVKVDAGNGAVLSQESTDETEVEDASEGSEGPYAGEANESRQATPAG